MKIKVLDIKGKETGKEVSLDKSIFGVDVNNHAVYLSVKQYLANQRQGTHKAKEKGEITASTRKIKKQKGTGTARAGSIKSPIFRGGGRVFGPRVRSYSFKLNKKIKDIARKSVLTQKAKDKNISILEDFSFDAPKTKEFDSILKSLEIINKKLLFIMLDRDKNVYLSSKNIKGVNIIAPDNINVYNVLNSERILITEEALKFIHSK